MPVETSDHRKGWGAPYYFMDLARPSSPHLVPGPKRKPQQTVHSCRISVSGFQRNRYQSEPSSALKAVFHAQVGLLGNDKIVKIIVNTRKSIS